MDDLTQDNHALPGLHKESSFVMEMKIAVEEEKKEEEPEDKFARTFSGKLKTILNY